MMPKRKRLEDGRVVYVHPCWVCKRRGYFPGLKVVAGEEVPDHDQKIPCFDCNGKKYIEGRKGVPYAR